MKWIFVLFLIGLVLISGCAQNDASEKPESNVLWMEDLS